MTRPRRSTRAADPSPPAGTTPSTNVCPLNEVLDRVSGKWAIGVLTLIGAEEVARFTELERGIPGISRRMLTLTLRNLERDGLLTRTVYATVPPRTEYRLTEAARELAQTLSLLTDWAERHRTHVQVSRLAYDEADRGRRTVIAADDERRVGSRPERRHELLHRRRPVDGVRPLHVGQRGVRRRE